MRLFRFFSYRRNLDHLSNELRDFLFHMQQYHGLTTPLFRSDMDSIQLSLARQLVEEHLLVERELEESDAENTTCYAAPHPSWFYFGRTEAVADFT